MFEIVFPFGNDYIFIDAVHTPMINHDYDIGNSTHLKRARTTRAIERWYRMSTIYYNEDRLVFIIRIAADYVL